MNTNVSSISNNLSFWTLANVIIWRVCGMPMFIVREIGKHRRNARLNVASKQPYFLRKSKVCVINTTLPSSLKHHTYAKTRNAFKHSTLVQCFEILNRIKAKLMKCWTNVFGRLT